METRNIVAGVLEVAYQEHGPREGWPVVLCHGFPYDIHSYEEVAPLLAAQNARVIVPYLRGYGPTRFLSAETPRSGEQAALGSDLLSLMDALEIETAIVGGYDWGGRAACIVSALWPERVTALVSGNSYNIQNIAKSMEPADPATEASYWYQYYFHSERGRLGLSQSRKDIARQLWKMWSPNWHFDDATFNRTAPAFDNPDFVEVVIHSYRHRFGLVPGDPEAAAIEEKLSAQPPITVSSITIDGGADGVCGTTEQHAGKFTGPHKHLIWDTAGHNLPQERPQEWAQAVLAARDLNPNST